MKFNVQNASALKYILTTSCWMTTPHEVMRSHINVSGLMPTYQFSVALQGMIDAANLALDDSDRINLDTWDILKQTTGDTEWEHPYDLLTLACEGACSYWMDEDDVTEIKTTYHNGQVTSLTFLHEVQDNCYIHRTIGLMDIMRTCNMILTNPELFNTEVHRTIMHSMFTDDWDFDSHTADYIIQLAAFGELVYS